MSRPANHNDEGGLIKVPLYSDGERIAIWVEGLGRAQRAGSFMGTVGAALGKNDPSPLTPFAGGGIVDVDGVFHPFETDLATLYRLDAQGPNPWEAGYDRIG